MFYKAHTIYLGINNSREIQIEKDFKMNSIHRGEWNNGCTTTVQEVEYIVDEYKKCRNGETEILKYSKQVGYRCRE